MNNKVQKTTNYRNEKRNNAYCVNYHDYCFSDFGSSYVKFNFW